MNSIVVYMAPAGCLWLHADVFDVCCCVSHVPEQLSRPSRSYFPSLNKAGSTIQNTETSMSVSSSSVELTMCHMHIKYICGILTGLQMMFGRSPGCSSASTIIFVHGLVSLLTK